MFYILRRRAKLGIDIIGIGVTKELLSYPL